MSTSSTLTPSGRTARPARIPAQRVSGSADRRPTRAPATARVKAPVTAPVTGAAKAPAKASAKGSVRLTRRGRLVVTLLLLGLILGAFVAFGGQSVATGEAGAPVPTRTVVVGEGDTLWAIASEVAEDGDIREVVHEIEQLNSLPGPVLEVGQEIAVPVQ